MLIGFFGKTFFATLMAYDFSLQEGETIQTVKMGGGGVRTRQNKKKVMHGGNRKSLEQ
jgi:hypothetical protein